MLSFRRSSPLLSFPSFFLLSSPFLASSFVRFLWADAWLWFSVIPSFFSCSFSLPFSCSLSIGRLLLADALSWIQAYSSPSILLDLATLTGACVIALGEELAGLFCNDLSLARMQE